MNVLVLLILLLPSLVLANDFTGQFSGEVALEHRYFSNEGKYGNQNQHHSALLVQPEYSYSWDNDRKVFSIVPFARVDQVDTERTHYDIRELSFVSAWSNVELRFGISKVFWGVTESQHLVDVINQTDFIENPDGEQKLGQPMINPTLVTDAGNLDVFILPYFREQTFAGKDGRFRGALVIDTDEAEYTHKDEHQHIDYAVRWGTNWQDLDWAVSYFSGTDRDPFLRVDAVNNTLIPVYGQSKQVGLEMQYIYKDLLIKAELLRKDPALSGLYSAATTGFEYTFTNIGDGIDIGLLYEWLYDTRDALTPSGMQDASFIGSRLAFNNEASTEILAGIIFDNDSTDMSLFRVEASHRFTQSFSLAVEVNVIGDPPINSWLHQFRADDYIQFTFSSYY